MDNTNYRNEKIQRIISMANTSRINHVAMRKDFSPSAFFPVRPQTVSMKNLPPSKIPAGSILNIATRKLMVTIHQNK